jgi:hypothetical protein
MPVKPDAGRRPTVDARYATLKQTLRDLGLVRPGSLVERYMPCGRSTCRCMADPPVLHGPYYQWTHKIEGKTVTRRLSAAQAAVCRTWMANHRALKALVRRMEALSLTETDRILRTISDS